MCAAEEVGIDIAEEKIFSAQGVGISDTIRVKIKLPQDVTEIARSITPCVLSGSLAGSPPTLELRLIVGISRKRCIEYQLDGSQGSFRDMPLEDLVDDTVRQVMGRSPDEDLSIQAAFVEVFRYPLGDCQTAFFRLELSSPHSLALLPESHCLTAFDTKWQASGSETPFGIRPG